VCRPSRIVPNTANRPAAAPSGLNTDMFRALEAVSKRMYPGAATLPNIMTGATDMAQRRAKGIQCYGIGPESTDEELSAHGWHSDVERATASSIAKLAGFTSKWRLRNKRGTQHRAHSAAVSSLHSHAPFRHRRQARSAANLLDLIWMLDTPENAAEPFHSAGSSGPEHRGSVVLRGDPGVQFARTPPDSGTPLP
jgi:hypothetical protein